MWQLWNIMHMSRIRNARPMLLNRRPMKHGFKYLLFMSAEQILINNGIQYIQEEIFIYMSKPIVEKQMIRNS